MFFSNNIYNPRLLSTETSFNYFIRVHLYYADLITLISLKYIRSKLVRVPQTVRFVSYCHLLR